MILKFAVDVNLRGVPGPEFLSVDKLAFSFEVLLIFTDSIIKSRGVSHLTFLSLLIRKPE